MLHRIWQAHTDAVQALAFGTDGCTLVSGSWDNTIKLWNVERGMLLWEGWRTGDVYCMAIAPDGHLLASGGHGHRERYFPLLPPTPFLLLSYTALTPHLAVSLGEIIEKGNTTFMTPSTVPTRTTCSFPIGCHPLHAVVSVNYQLNRFSGRVGGPVMRDEMRTVSAGVSDYPTFQRIFIALGEHDLVLGETLKGATYLRLAECFLPVHDERKHPIRRRFIQEARDYYGVTPEHHRQIPFVDGWLSAYENGFSNERERDADQ